MTEAPRATPGDVRLSRCDKCGVVAPLDPPADGIHQGCGGHVEYLRSPGDARRLLVEKWRKEAGDYDAVARALAGSTMTDVTVKKVAEAFTYRRCADELEAALSSEAEAPRPHPVLLEIASLVNSYHNDGSTRTAGETLAVIARALGEPMSMEAPPRPAEAAPAGLRERLLSQAEYMETGGPFGAVPRVVETDSDVWRTAIALLLEAAALKSRLEAAEQEITRLREALAKESQTEKTKT